MRLVKYAPLIIVTVLFIFVLEQFSFLDISNRCATIRCRCLSRENKFNSHTRNRNVFATNTPPLVPHKFAFAWPSSLNPLYYFCAANLGSTNRSPFRNVSQRFPRFGSASDTDAHRDLQRLVIRISNCAATRRDRQLNTDCCRCRSLVDSFCPVRLCCS